MPPQAPTNVYPCLDWIPRGVAKEKPQRLKLNSQELKTIIESAKNRALEARKKLGQALKEEAGTSNLSSNKNTTTTTNNNSKSANNKKDDDDDDDVIMKEYGLEDYDDEGNQNIVDHDNEAEMSEEDDVESNINTTTRATTLGLAQDIASLTYHASNAEDPYLTRPQVPGQLEDDDAEEENELIIKNTDNLIVAGHLSKDESSIEVYVYDNEQNNFYLHHDIIQSDYPCCVRWVGHARNQSRNLAAAGYMNPDIYLWDLDVVDVLEPMETIKGHKDAVIDIAWNSQVKNILASGSADKHVIIWSLDECKSISNLKLPGKVSALEFGIYEQFLLLAGDLSSNVSLIDTRTSAVTDKWKLGGEVERVRWIPTDHSKFLVSDDQGCIYYFDIRYTKNSEPLVKFKAHQSSVTGLEFSPKCDNMLVTASADDTIKVWDTKLAFSGTSSGSISTKSEPILVKEVADLNVGRILSLRICPDSFALIAVGGDNKINSFKTHDLTLEKEVKERFMGTFNNNNNNNKIGDNGF